MTYYVQYERHVNVNINIIVGVGWCLVGWCLVELENAQEVAVAMSKLQTAGYLLKRYLHLQ
jgi:hypothetical protein